MDEADDELELPVLRLHPLPEEQCQSVTGRRIKSARLFNNRASSVRSQTWSRSGTPDRLTFPGQQRPKSAAYLLRELQTSTIGRQKNSLRQTPEPEDVKHLPDEPKKVSREELETIVSRLQRQTNSGRARTALTRRINQQKLETPKSVRIDYLAFDPVRFRGLRKVSKVEMEGIVSRLSSFSKDRKPAESERYEISRENHKKLGVLNSYRWKGISNC